MAKTLIKNLVSVDIQVILHYALPFLANLLFFEPSLGPWRSRQNLHAEFLAQSLQGAQFLGSLHSFLVSPEDDSVYREVHEQKWGRFVCWGSRCGHDKRKMHVKSFILYQGAKSQGTSNSSAKKCTRWGVRPLKGTLSAQKAFSVSRVRDGDELLWEVEDNSVLWCD